MEEVLTTEPPTEEDALHEHESRVVTPASIEDVSARLLSEEEVDNTINGEVQDPGQERYDSLVVSKLIEEAMRWCKDHGIIISDNEQREASGILTKVGNVRIFHIISSH